MPVPVVQRLAWDAISRFTSVPLADVSVTPTTEGLPGAAFIQKLLDWAAQIGLYASLLSILVGGAGWGLSHHFGHAGGVSKGRLLLLGGVIGAILVGLGPSLVNLFYSAAKA